MSHRELRDFSEMMRSLGFPEAVSITAFREPDFPLVVRCLSWLTKRLDPHADFLTDISKPQDRVQCITSIVRALATRSHIKPSCKRLYRGDGHAVREMLKVARVLYNAQRAVDPHVSGAARDTFTSASAAQRSTQLGDLQTARKLASEITSGGAALHDLLEQEVEGRELRSGVIARPLDLEHIEDSLKTVIREVESDINQLREQLDSLVTDEGNLKAKIEKRSSELQRTKKRLRSLKEVRPAFMDEYERLEKKMAKLYRVYMERFRNLDYLEHRVDVYNRQHAATEENTRRSLKAMRARLQRNEDNEYARGAHAATEDHDDAFGGGGFSGGEGMMMGDDEDEFGSPGGARPSTRRESNRRSGVTGTMDLPSDSQSSEDDFDGMARVRGDMEHTTDGFGDEFGDEFGDDSDF